MNNWKYKLYQFMQGRYGIDALGRFLLIAAMIIILLSNFIHFRGVYLLGMVMLVLAYLRIMSRNISKRQQENQKFFAIKSRFSKNKNSQNYNANASMQYNFYRCRSCGQTIRVPKGKGTLKITCPGCGNSFIEQT